MSKEHYEIGIQQLQKAISFNLQAGFYLASLILLYSAIDTMAWLNRSPNAPENARVDFLKWVDSYLLPNSKTSCSAVDLYAARCSILHSSTSESSLSAKGAAKKLFYCYGVAKCETLQKAVDRSSQSGKAIVVAVDELIANFTIGIQRYNEVLTCDPLLATMVYERAEKFFSLIPIELINQEGE